MKDEQVNVACAFFRWFEPPRFLVLRALGGGGDRMVRVRVVERIAPDACHAESVGHVMGFVLGSFLWVVVLGTLFVPPLHHPVCETASLYICISFPRKTKYIYTICNIYIHTWLKLIVFLTEDPRGGEWLSSNFCAASVKSREE